MQGAWEQVVENMWTWGETMAGERRKLHIEELHSLYFLSNIWLIKSRRMSWVGHLSYTRQERSSYKVFVWKPEVNKPLLSLGRDLRIILRCLWRKWSDRFQIGLVRLRRCFWSVPLLPFWLAVVYVTLFYLGIAYFTLLFFILFIPPPHCFQSVGIDWCWSHYIWKLVQ